MKEVISLLQKRQGELSEKYAELEALQGELPHAYGIIQDDMQRVDEINECYRIAICNLELAMKLESEAV